VRLASLPYGLAPPTAFTPEPVRRRVAGMKHILLMIAVVALVGCEKATKEKAAKIKAAADARVAAEKKATETATIPQQPKTTSEKLITDPIVEKAVRKQLEKPEGELTKADLAKVTSLALGHTQITDAGLKDVAKMQKLTTLRLGGTKTTDAGLGFLSKMQQLTYLDLTATQITDAGAAELQKALPKCEILHSHKK
jgi:hypothetical protein